MDIRELQDIAVSQGLDIYNYKMKKNKGRIIGKSIFLDYSRLNTSIEEKCVLAEEIGHYIYDGYYTIESSQEEIDRAEYKAMKWRCLKCIPPEALINCFNKGIKTLFDIAEELEVLPGMVLFAYHFYLENDLLKTNA